MKTFGETLLVLHFFATIRTNVKTARFSKMRGQNNARDDMGKFFKTLREQWKLLGTSIYTGERLEETQLKVR